MADPTPPYTQELTPGVVLDEVGRDARTGLRVFRVLTVREPIEEAEAKRQELVRLAELAAMPAQGRA